MRKESFISSVVCGCLLLSAAPASAEWIWNPFEKRSEPSSESTVPLRTNAPGLTHAPVTGGLSRAAYPNRASLEQREPTQSASPITNSTYRLILEESQNYPQDVRQKFVRGFSKLSDSEARKRIERIRRARAQQSPDRTDSGTDRTYAGTASPEQSFQAASSRLSEPGSQVSTPGIAAPRSSLPEWSQFTQQIPGRSSTGHSPQQPGDAFPASMGQQAANALPPAHASVEQNGYSRVPRDSAFQSQSSRNDFTSGPQIIPTGHSSTLPIIRPANAPHERSRYVSHYVPDQAASRPNTGLSNAEPGSSNQASGSNTNSDSIAPSTDEPQLETLIARMESLAEKSQAGSTEASLQQHITTHVELRLLYLISEEKDRALTAIPGVSREEQIFWTRIFWGLTNYLDRTGTSTKQERSTVAIDQLRHAIQSLKGEAQFTIRKVEFCSEIENFGNYTRYNRDEFSPGQEILVYCELENFQSEQTDAGIHRTLLKSSIQIRKAGLDGQLIDEVPYNPTEDLCRSQRKDFMQGFKYRLPQRLSSGPYVLQLVIEDQLSGQSASSTMNFMIK